MTEDIPLEITSSDMANLPIFIAVLIVAAAVVRVYFSIKRNEKPPIARVFWCATLLIPLGMVAAWITNQLLVNEDSSLWVLSYSALGAAAVILLVEPLVSGLIDQTDLATERLPVFAVTSLSSPLFQRSRSFHSKLPATKRSIAFPPTHSGFPSGCSRRFCSPFICWDSVMEASWPSCPSSVASLALPGTSS
ncbi:MAG: hypothetical protein ACLRM9_04400 [Collinsella aerofaciens]